MGIKQLYNENLRKLPNEYGDISVMTLHTETSSMMAFYYLKEVIKLRLMMFDMIRHISLDVQMQRKFMLMAVRIPKGEL